MTSRAALARHPLAVTGALIATASFVAFAALAIASAAALFDNPYAGLVIFIALPALFVFGLLLIPAGMWLQHRRRQLDPAATAEWPVLDFRKPEVRRTALLVTALTAINIVIVLLAGYGGLHAMDSPRFCGQACHTPMQPQFMTWQASPHSRVRCVDCHIGEGAAAMLHYKLAGVRQLVHLVTNRYPRPIPGGVDMRPAFELCGHCHDPRRRSLDRTRVFREYADDENNSETKTVLVMHVGGPGPSTEVGPAIHWHADPLVRIEYVALDNARQSIPYVKRTDRSGRTKEFAVQSVTPAQLSQGRRRIMDCIDCHNAIGHPTMPTPEKAVDEALSDDRIDRRLPFVRREGVRLLRAAYASHDLAALAIEQSLRDFYRGRPVDRRAVTRAISALQSAHRQNVFPTMKVTWGTYADNIGHLTSTGCFRCHDDNHMATDGSTISGDCEYCHTQIEPSP